MKEIKFRAIGLSGKMFNDIETPKAFLIHNLPVMQFTGLKDKNGKEIYEGDVILFQLFANWDNVENKRHLATVIFEKGCFCWEIKREGRNDGLGSLSASNIEPLKRTNSTWGLEVIGNIYENPELLS